MIEGNEKLWRRDFTVCTRSRGLSHSLENLPSMMARSSSGPRMEDAAVAAGGAGGGVGFAAASSPLDSVNIHKKKMLLASAAYFVI